VGEIIKTLQPTKQLIAMARAMFRHGWDQRIAQAKNALATGKRQIADFNKQIDALLARILDASNARVIQTYEAKIAELEKSKALAADQLAKQAEPKGSFEEHLEPVLTFLANPWKLWETGHTALRRTVVKLAFTDRLEYCRKEGPRTPKIALPFKALRGLNTTRVCFGAPSLPGTDIPKFGSLNQIVEPTA